MTKELKKENFIMQYFRETWAELRKVNWPTFDEAKNLTLVVVVTIFAMSVFLGVFVDSVFSYLVRFLLAR